MILICKKNAQENLNVENCDLRHDHMLPDQVPCTSGPSSKEQFSYNSCFIRG